MTVLTSQAVFWSFIASLSIVMEGYDGESALGAVLTYRPVPRRNVEHVAVPSILWKLLS